MRSPVCIFCGSPNPRPLSDFEWEELIDWAEHYPVGEHIRTAIRKRSHGEH